MIMCPSGRSLLHSCQLLPLTFPLMLAGDPRVFSILVFSRSLLAHPFVSSSGP